MGFLDKVKSAAHSAVGQAEELLKQQKAASEERAAAQKQAAAEETYLKKLKPCGREIVYRRRTENAPTAPADWMTMRILWYITPNTPV